MVGFRILGLEGEPKIKAGLVLIQDKCCLAPHFWEGKSLPRFMVVYLVELDKISLRNVSTCGEASRVHPVLASGLRSNALIYNKFKSA